MVVSYRPPLRRDDRRFGSKRLSFVSAARPPDPNDPLIPPWRSYAPFGVQRNHLTPLTSSDVLGERFSVPQRACLQSRQPSRKCLS